MEPVRLRPLRIPDRPAGAPLAAITGLHPPLSSFVGRLRELDELERLVGESRLLTLTGSGGSGKTRLAVELAGRVADQFEGGTYFVDAAPLRDAKLLPATVAGVLGVHREAQRPLLDTIVDRLAEEHALILLDNLEHLPGAATLVGDLLRACSGLQIVATSRAPLHCEGEHEYQVDPLALPMLDDLGSLSRLAETDAVALFVARARGVDPRFELTNENSRAIADICRGVDGLPLAIELAAARSKVLTPDALLRRLERRLSLLTTGTADRPARQQSLRAAIAWSYNLLGPWDAIVFARTGVFLGGFSLPAAEAIVPDPDGALAEPLLDTLSRLVDNSLLRAGRDADGEPRFSMLETIREFALEQLTATEAATLRERHARHFAFIAQTAHSRWGHASAILLRRFTDDPDNFRAALNWAHDNADGDLLARLASALRVPLGAVGHPEEAGRWLHAAHALVARAAPTLRATLLYELVRFDLGMGGDRRRAERLIRESLRAAQQVRDPTGQAWALAMLSNIAADRGDRPASAAYARRAQAAARLVQDPVERARLLAENAVAGTGARSPAQGCDLAEEAIGLARELDDPVSLTDGLIALGIAALAIGDVDRAVESLSEAVAIQLEGGPDIHLAKQMLAIARLRAGDVEGSRQLVLDTLRSAPSFGTIWFLLAVLEGAADWVGAAGSPDQAVTLWGAIDAQRAVQMDRTSGYDVGLFEASRRRERASLSEQAHDAALMRGRALSLGDAVDYAIAAIDAVPPRKPAGTLRSGRRDRYVLTAREQEVLAFVAAGRSDGDIAEALSISKKTAAVHVANIKGKFGAASRVEIATMAVRRGLIQQQHGGKGRPQPKSTPTATASPRAI